MDLVAPHDILGQKIGDKLPQNEALCAMMKKSYDILVNHPINEARRKNGQNPANSCWFWGAGTKPILTSFEERTHKRGAMISAVDLLKGIAVGTGMKVVTVDGANGGLDTNYEGKAQAAVDVLTKEGYDFVYVHVEAPDEMGHQGSAMKKVTAIERLDERVIAPDYRRACCGGGGFPHGGFAGSPDTGRAPHAHGGRCALSALRQHEAAKVKSALP